MQPKRVVKKRMKYSPEQLALAVKAVVEGGCSIRAASKLYQVPATTVGDRVSGRVPIFSSGPGPAPILNSSEEALLVQYVMAMSSIGFGYTRSDIMRLANEYLCSMDRKQLSSRLSSSWWIGFIRRCPELNSVVVKPEVSRAKVLTDEVIGKYYGDLKMLLDEINMDVNPECLFYVNESTVQACDNPIKSESASAMAASASLDCKNTIFSSGNAVDSCIPPFIIYKSQNFDSDLLKISFSGSSGIVSATGNANSQAFKRFLEHFLQNCYCPATKLLLFDSPKPYINPDTVAWAKERDIIVFVLPPHTPLLLQSLQDYASFSDQYSFYEQKFLSENDKVTKDNIAEIASNAYKVSMSDSNIRTLFKTCGVSPFEPVPLPDSE